MSWVPAALSFPPAQHSGRHFAPSPTCQGGASGSRDHNPHICPALHLPPPHIAPRVPRGRLTSLAPSREQGCCVRPQTAVSALAAPVKPPSRPRPQLRGRPGISAPGSRLPRRPDVKRGCPAGLQPSFPQRRLRAARRSWAPAKDSRWADKETTRLPQDTQPFLPGACSLTPGPLDGGGGGAAPPLIPAPPTLCIYRCVYTCTHALCY